MSVRFVLDTVLDRQNLRRTLTIAAVVGTILFMINQLDVVLAGDASTATWVKGSITFVVPFIVSNLGVVQGRHRSREINGAVDHDRLVPADR